MVKIEKAYQLNGSVISIHSNETHYYFANNNGEIFDVKRGSSELNKHTMLHEAPDPLHVFQKGAAFSKNNQIVYSSNLKGSCAMSSKLLTRGEEEELKVNQEAPLCTHESTMLLSGHDQRAEVAKFCGDKSQYIFTGGSDGKILMYSSTSGKILMSLKPNPDFISHISINDEGNLIAYASFDKSFRILDIRHQKELSMSYPGDVIQDSAFYQESKLVYAIGKEGTSYTFDYKKNLVSKKDLFSTWPSCCVIECSSRFAIVGTRGGYLHIVKLIDNTMLSTFKLDQKGVSSLHLDNSSLIVGFENGWTYVIDMYAYIDEFSQAVSIQNFKVAKRLLDKNIFLGIHPISQVFEDSWDDVLNDILNQFASGNSSNSLEMAAPFMMDEARKSEFEFLHKKQKEFEKFTIAIQNKKIFEAYGLLIEHPFLDKTDNAKKLELFFTKTFAEAKKLLFSDSLQNYKKAEDILKPYLRVECKKDLIFSLMKDRASFLQAEKCIKEKDFINYFRLVEQNPFLKNEDMYNKVSNLAVSTIKKIKLMIEQRLYDESIAGIKQIISFLPYKDELITLVTKIQHEKKFLLAIASNNIQEVYKMVNSDPELESMQEFIDLEKSFDNTLSKGLEAVSKGEIKLTQAIFTSYASIPIYKPKIRECIRQASYNKLTLLLNEKNIVGAKTIASYYLKEFGEDDDYLKLIKKHGL
jgi:WD40 repeat protein